MTDFPPPGPGVPPGPTPSPADAAGFPPPTGPGLTGEPPPGASDAPPRGPRLGQVAFGLSLVGCTVLAAFGSAVLAVVALARPGGRGKGWAAAALALDIAWVAIVVATLPGLLQRAAEVTSPGGARDRSGQIVDESTVDRRKLRVGDCLNDGQVSDLDDRESTTVVGGVEAVPCTSSHRLEVFYVRELSGEEYPGEDTVVAQAQRMCGRAFPGFVGVSPRESRLDIYYYYPTSRSWRLQDDHQVVCLVSDPEQPSTSSLRESRQ